MQAIARDSVDALLFDLGGVIIDVDFNRALERWARHARCDPGALQARFAQDSHYARHERGEIDAAAYFASLRAALGIAITDEQFHDGWGALLGGEIAGMAALLQRAGDRLPLYLFSNSNAAHHEIWSRRYAGVLSRFRRVFVSYEIGKRKPEPEAFRTVAAAMGVAVSQIAFFDDSPENVEGARAIGMRAVHVRSLADVETSLKSII
jgi:putative hydrolase of the HAD superfamily